MKNKPIVIARSDKFAMAISMSSNLKKKGFNITDKIFQIKQVVPDLIVIRPNLSYYQFLSNQFFNFLAKKVSSELEIYSIDECFIDISTFATKFSTVEFALFYIKKIVKENLELPISIGVSHNKLLAKMATNIAKHNKNNIFWLKPNMLNEFIFNKPIGNLIGIGKARMLKLKKINIQTINDFIALGDTNPELIQIFGVTTKYFFENLLGVGDNSIVDRKSNFKIISRFNTFLSSEDVDNKKATLLIQEFLKDLVEKLVSNNKQAGKVEIFLKTKTNETIHFYNKLEFPTANFEIIYSKALELLNQIDDFSEILGLGVNLTNIFENSTINKKTNKKVAEIIENLNKKFDKKLIIAKALKK
ncbi:DNA polymerase IV [Mesomycoplasma bovoculi M165/69]|uniref:DNA polymerase IV n=1 Tax=Mesomycoplasma bovoculi M165/69 TaxID=743966 RepID=W5USH5_9BACT|nr:DNA polymerase IV [Mesomycoplasma bovoculi M165/69]